MALVETSLPMNYEMTLVETSLPMKIEMDMVETPKPKVRFPRPICPVTGPFRGYF